jgi:hypothetical protein
MPKTLKKDNKEGNEIVVAEPNTITITNDDVSGDFDRSDILIPSIRQVQKTGELSELHTPGSWVLNQDELLSDGASPVKLIVLKFRKYFSENIEWGSEEQPRLAETLQDVAKMGGTTQWGTDGEAPSFIAMGDATVLVEGTNEALFPFEYELTNTRYAMARWTMRNTAFKRAGRKIITEAQFGLKGGLEHGDWSLYSGKAKAGNNTYFVPILTLDGKNDEDLAKWANSQG